MTVQIISKQIQLSTMQHLEIFPLSNVCLSLNIYIINCNRVKLKVELTLSVGDILHSAALQGVPRAGGGRSALSEVVSHCHCHSLVTFFFI